MSTHAEQAAKAKQAAFGAGVVTLVLGTALTAAPDRVGPVGGLVDPRGARIVGLADLLLVPGLLFGRPRWPWIAGRAAFNIPTAAYALALGRRGAPRARLAARGLLAITCVDLLATHRLRRHERR